MNQRNGNTPTRELWLARSRATVREVFVPRPRITVWCLCLLGPTFLDFLKVFPHPLNDLFSLGILKLITQFF